MENPYKTPETELVQKNNNFNLLNSFEKFSTWNVFGLMIITLSLYLLYWIYTRTKILNTLPSVEPIDDAFINTCLALFFVSIGLAVGEVYMGDNAAYILTSQFISMMSNIFLIVWAFKFKNRLNTYLSNHVSGCRYLGPFMTFFFQVLYLSYKLNENMEIMEANKSGDNKN